MSSQGMSEPPMESGMASGSDEGTPGEHIGLGQQVSDESAPDDVIAAVEDDAPLPPKDRESKDDESTNEPPDPDTPVFLEP